MKKLFFKKYSLMFLIPGLLIYTLLYLIPSVIGVYYSFFNWNLFEATFCGFENYVRIITNSRLNIAIKNTLIFASMTTFLKVFLGLLLAVLLNMNLKTKNVLRTLFFVPSIMNNVAIGIAFIAILHPVTGILNNFLRTVGLGFLAQSWLTNITLAIYSVSMIEVWKWSGFTMIIFLGGLQTIDESYYEAADIDGASSLAKFRNITLPLLMPFVNNAVVLSLIGGLKVFDIVFITTKGGPGKASSVLGTVIFESFGGGRLGEASAGSVILSLIVAVFAITFYKLIRKREVEL